MVVELSRGLSGSEDMSIANPGTATTADQEIRELMWMERRKSGFIQAKRSGQRPVPQRLLLPRALMEGP